MEIIRFPRIPASMRVDRVVDHGFVENRKKLFAECRCYGIKSCTGSTSKNYIFRAVIIPFYSFLLWKKSTTQGSIHLLPFYKIRYLTVHRIQSKLIFNKVFYEKNIFYLYCMRIFYISFLVCAEPLSGRRNKRSRVFI